MDQKEQNLQMAIADFNAGKCKSGTQAVPLSTFYYRRAVSSMNYSPAQIAINSYDVGYRDMACLSKYSTK